MINIEELGIYLVDMSKEINAESVLYTVVTSVNEGTVNYIQYPLTDIQSMDIDMFRVRFISGFKEFNKLLHSTALVFADGFEYHGMESALHGGSPHKVRSLSDALNGEVYEANTTTNGDYIQRYSFGVELKYGKQVR